MLVGKQSTFRIFLSSLNQLMVFYQKAFQVAFIDRKSMNLIRLLHTSNSYLLQFLIMGSSPLHFLL